MNSAVLVMVLFRNESHMSRIGLTWISECLIMHQKVWVIWGLWGEINMGCIIHQFFTVTSQYGSWQQSVYLIYLQAFQITDMCTQWLHFLLIINGHFISSITETSSSSKSQKLLWASYALLCLTWSGLYMNDLIYRLESLSW